MQTGTGLEVLLNVVDVMGNLGVVALVDKTFYDQAKYLIQKDARTLY